MCRRNLCDILRVLDNRNQDMIRSMLYHNSHMFRHTIRNILDSQNIEHQLLYNYSNLEAFHETFKRKILQIIEIYIWLFTFIISRIIINRIRINIREHRRITKIYGGAKLRFESFKLLIPPGKKVLGYLTNEKKQRSIFHFYSNWFYLYTRRHYTLIIQ